MEMSRCLRHHSRPPRARSRSVSRRLAGGYCRVMSDDLKPPGPNDIKPPGPDVSFEFGHDPAAARLARQAIAPLLHEDGQFAHDVELVTSEIVSNVVEHTHDGGRLDAWDDDPLVLEVVDYDPIIPTIPPAASERGGRGLLLVDGLAEEWGVAPTDTGKVVWAKLQRPTVPGDPPGPASDVETPDAPTTAPD